MGVATSTFQAVQMQRKIISSIEAQKKRRLHWNYTNGCCNASQCSSENTRTRTHATIIYNNFEQTSWKQTQSTWSCLKGLERSNKYSLNWCCKMVMKPMGSQSVKHHKKKTNPSQTTGGKKTLICSSLQFPFPCKQIMVNLRTLFGPRFCTTNLGWNATRLFWNSNKANIMDP